MRIEEYFRDKSCVAGVSSTYGGPFRYAAHLRNFSRQGNNCLIWQVIDTHDRRW